MSGKSIIPKVKLSDGNTIPVIGLGTSEAATGDKSELIKVIKYAIRIGYRHIDSSWITFRDAIIGRAIQEIFDEPQQQDLKLTREDIFLASKLWNTHHSKNMVEAGLNDSLKNLNVDYLDLFYMNWPIAFQENPGTIPYPRDSNKSLIFSNISYLETYKAMEECVRSGKVTSLGLKNFNMQQIQDIFDNCTIKPAVVQVESHPYFQNSSLIEFCQSKNITVVVFSPHGAADLADVIQGMPKLIEDEVLIKIGRKYNKTPAQVCIRWSLQRGCIPIAKSTNPAHIQENIDVFDFELSEEDMGEIKRLEKNLRIFKAQE